ncbi:MAG: M20/M25/M40 family metallo-hydrolase [Ignavibacteriales bacterium]|nr:M20/M25/M40 family metallo-hydrolase [Ignavibacteriales bacterium]
MNLSQIINDKSKQYQDYTANNLSELIKIKSLSTKEGAVVKKLKEMMADAGFDEIKIDGLGNIIGRLGSGKKIIAIDGHIDTVDIGNIQNWTFDPLGGEIKDGFVHGRGSVDQKGGPIAAITAAKILREIGLPKDVTLYVTGTVIEEDCDGLCWKYIIEEDKIKPDCVIVTEPTNLNIYRGHRGSNGNRSIILWKICTWFCT